MVTVLNMAWNSLAKVEFQDYVGQLYYPTLVQIGIAKSEKEMKNLRLYSVFPSEIHDF